LGSRHPDGPTLKIIRRIYTTLPIGSSWKPDVEPPIRTLSLRMRKSGPELESLFQNGAHVRRFLRNLYLQDDAWVENLLKKAWEKATDNNRRGIVVNAQMLRRNRMTR
jgi:hypothetical protein